VLLFLAAQMPGASTECDAVAADSARSPWTFSRRSCSVASTPSLVLGHRRRTRADFFLLRRHRIEQESDQRSARECVTLGRA